MVLIARPPETRLRRVSGKGGSAMQVIRKLNLPPLR